MSNLNSQALPIYREVQHFRQLWIWLIVLGVGGLLWYAFVIQLLLQRPFGATPMPDTLLIIFWLIFGIGLPIFFLTSRLVTEVRDDGIYIRFLPFQRAFRKIVFEHVKHCEARTYKPLQEYGGWGVRNSRNGIAFNVHGNQGVQLELNNGRRILIGSQHPEELLQAIQSKL